MSVPLEVRLKDVAAEPIASYSGIYCFTDLKLAAGNYTLQISSAKSNPDRYFDVEKQFTLTPIPPATDPLKRNLVEVNSFRERRTRLMGKQLLHEAGW